MRGAQIWSIDYTIALTLFLLAIIVALKVIANHYTSTTFDELNDEAFIATEYLMGPGNPEDWDNVTLVTLGLMTGSALNVTKLRAFYAMDPTRTLGHLRMTHPYILYFEDKDNGIIYFNGTCSYGDEDVRNNGTVRYTSVAYYRNATDGESLFESIMTTTYDASVYIRDEATGTVVDGVVLNGSLDLLLRDINYYDALFLENPRFDEYAGNHTPAEVGEIISSWVSKGNVLFLTQQAGIDVAGGSFPALADGAGNLTIIAEHVDSPFVLGDSMILDDKFTVTPLAGAHDVVLIANYTNDVFGLALWGYGEGQVFFAGDLSGLYGTENDITAEVNYTLSRQAMGFCEGLTLSAIQAENIVTMERYVVFNNKIARMVLIVWNEP